MSVGDVHAATRFRRGDRPPSGVGEYRPHVEVGEALLGCHEVGEARRSQGLGDGAVPLAARGIGLDATSGRAVEQHRLRLLFEERVERLARAHQPAVPGSPLNGPTTSVVIHPP